ncbi:hypothetical protein [Novosphingobium sp.]|nr:hypothetical protein [Novosphingobium sp.]HKR92839.1 hypothetical protein [Novosphingobium sp.]
MVRIHPQTIPASSRDLGERISLSGWAVAMGVSLALWWLILRTLL